MPPRTKKKLVDVLRVVVCGVALWIVVRGITLHDHVSLKDGASDLVGAVRSDGDPLEIELTTGTIQRVPRDAVALDEDGALKVSYGLASAWRNSTKSYLLLALVIHFPVVFPLALRLQWLLRAQKIAVGYGECVKLSFAGNFLNFATPFGSNAGDVFKAYFASLHTDRKTEAVTTVFLDRILGLATLLVLVAAMTALSPKDSRLALFRPYMLAVIGVGVVGTLAYLSPPLRRWAILRTWVNKLPMSGQLKRVDAAARTLAGHTRTLVGAVLLTVLLQTTALVAYFTVAVALAMEAGAGNVLEYFAYYYTGTIVAALPGPPQGLGTVELTYRYFFAPFGSASQIVCMAFGIRIIVLFCSLPGLLVTLTGSYKPGEMASGVDSACDALPPRSAVPKRDWVSP